MHRIDTSTAQKDKFGAGKNGFTAGNPQTGVPPTEVSADILDALQEEICAVVEVAGLSLDKENNSQLLSAIKKLESSRYFSAGQPLPLSNIGPIWHDDYHDWMTWQTFNQNGANYTGYASRLIGSLLLDTQPTPRSGYIKSGVQNLSRVTYAALRAWAMHNGVMVAPGEWIAGTIKCADNTDGTTFRVYDVRGEFLRAQDDGRGVDAGRLFGTHQLDELRVHSHTVSGTSVSVAFLAPGPGRDFKNGQVSTSETGGNETRPRNSALLAEIKY
ncbi:hypothetical protein RI534_13390 [Aeromonas allosaccharophila]|uniref:hypothetical protein n=1 Tax=Aeromonas allosaccharophila TaxID=656 RepID=UPI003414533B